MYPKARPRVGCATDGANRKLARGGVALSAVPASAHTVMLFSRLLAVVVLIYLQLLEHAHDLLRVLRLCVLVRTA